jgi:DNA-binding transcriptional LysR family regulator
MYSYEDRTRAVQLFIKLGKHVRPSNIGVRLQQLCWYLCGRAVIPKGKLVGLVCRSEHPLAERRSVRWSELGGLKIASTTAHRQLGDTPERALLKGKSLEVSNMLTLLSLLEQGVAQTVLPALALPRMISGLTFIPLAAPRRQREIGILRVRDRSLSPTALVVAGMITEMARNISEPYVHRVKRTGSE